MHRVEFYKLNNDGSQKIIATCRLDKNGMVKCEGDEVFVENLKSHGIKDYSNESGPKLFFKDGLKFLEQLKFNFHSGYLNATDVVTKDY